MADPVPPPLDPNYAMNLLQRAALQKLVENPATDPDTTPPLDDPPAGRSQQQQFVFSKGPETRRVPRGPGDAMANTAAAPAPASPEAHEISEQEMTDEVKQALEVLKRDGILEQVDNDSWRFK